jgi:hypothetical protein
MKRSAFIFLILCCTQTSFGWTLQDLLQKKQDNLRLKPFEGGNFIEKGFSQIQFVVEKDEGRGPVDSRGRLQDDREGYEYFLKFNPRGGGEFLAQQRLARVSEQLVKEQNLLWDQQEQLQFVLLCIEIMYTKKIEDLSARTITLLETQKTAQSKSLLSIESGSIKDFIKSSIAIKNFRKKVIEIHEKRAEIEQRIAIINPEWTIDTFVADESLLSRTKVLEHVKSYDEAREKLYTQIFDLQIRQLEQLQAYTASQNNRLVDTFSIGADDTREDTRMLSFRVSLNLPFISSNPVQDWQFENKIIDTKRQNLMDKNEKKVLVYSLRNKIIRMGKDLDLDVTTKYDVQIEKTFRRLKASEPLSTIALYADYLTAKISSVESERDLFLTYAEWLNESQDFQSSFLFHNKGLL